MIIKKRTFTASNAGPHILFFGAVHGTERCGANAINKVIDELDAGRLTLACGTVTFVPACNEKAYEKNIRFIDEDLNRVFKKHSEPKTYEQNLANELALLIDKCDIFLDIHSTQAGGPVNVFVDFPTAENRKFAEALGAPYAILGWPQIYAEKGRDLLSGDTTAYANEAGKTGVLIECGKNGDPEADEVAYNAIISALSYFKLINKVSPQADPSPLSADRPEVRPCLPMQEIIMTDLFVKNGEGDHFTEVFKHLDNLQVGQVIAVRETGEQIKAQEDCVMVLPKLKSEVGKEWFYLGKRVK